MENKILIYADRAKMVEFERDVETTQQGANDLIHIFESFQSYKKISSLDDFETLITDPLSMFDEALRVNVDFKESGGKKGNPAVIAQLFDIDRDNFINIVKGQTVIEGTCKPCSKLKIKQTREGVINYSSFKQYQEYLFFDAGSFSLNETAIASHLETFKTFASTPSQLAILDHWRALLQILNQHKANGYIGTSALELMGKQCGLRYVEGQLYLNDENLLSEILKAK